MAFKPKEGSFKFEVNDIQEKQFKRSGCFSTVPKGIVIMDTFNNPYYPISSMKIDNAIYNTKILKEDMHRLYGSDKQYLNLPWHYTVELIGRDYNIHATRPLMYRSAIPSWEEYISVCIVGDTNTDIYNKFIYKEIANAINSLKLLPGWRLKIEDLQYINIGDSFKKSQLKKDLI